jgi:hypothetical protein
MDLAQKLLSRRSDVEAVVSENKIVEDVLAGRSSIVSRTSRKNSGLGPATDAPFGIASAPDFAPVTGGPALQVLESRYIPKHTMESFDEYSKRLEMTPFFAETPGILQSRQGALFRKPPDVNAPPELSEFLKRATVSGMSWLDVVVKLSEQCQVGGFAGLLVDREILPTDVHDRAITQAEVSARGLGRVIVAPFAAHQIRDWATDRHGLVWVKLVELHENYDANWDGKKRDVYTVRVVDRVNITVWDIEKKKTGDFSVADPVVIPHGAVDASGRPVVPFRLFHPFPARDGIGRSNLRASADADVAATRLLSDLLWFMHMMAPILVLTTNREPGDIKNIGLGVSYLNVLQAARNGQPEEKLAYVQLDATAADKLANMYEKLCQRAREQANKSADAGVAGPVMQSGISKAWTFKTGEERVLFLLSVCLQEGLQWTLELAARSMGIDSTKVSIAFPQSYDITGVPEQLSIAEQALPLLAEYGLNTAAIHMLRKVGLALMGNPSDEEMRAFKAELLKLRSRDLNPRTQLSAPLRIGEKIPITEADTV